MELETVLLEFEATMDEHVKLAEEIVADVGGIKKLEAVLFALGNGITREEAIALQEGGVPITNQHLSFEDFKETRNGMNLVLAGEGLMSAVTSIVTAPFKIVAIVLVAVAALLYKFASWLFSLDKTSTPISSGTTYTLTVPELKLITKGVPAYFQSIKPANQEKAYKLWCKILGNYFGLQFVLTLPAESTYYTVNKLDTKKTLELIDVASTMVSGVTELALVIKNIGKDKTVLATLEKMAKELEKGITDGAASQGVKVSGSTPELMKLAGEAIRTDTNNVGRKAREMAADTSIKGIRDIGDVGSVLAKLISEYNDFNSKGYELIKERFKPFTNESTVRAAKAQSDEITKTFANLDSIEGLSKDDVPRLKELQGILVGQVKLSQIWVNSMMSVVNTITALHTPTITSKSLTKLANYIDETWDDRGKQTGYNKWPSVLDSDGKEDSKLMEEAKTIKPVWVKS